MNLLSQVVKFYRLTFVYSVYKMPLTSLTAEKSTGNEWNRGCPHHGDHLYLTIMQLLYTHVRNDKVIVFNSVNDIRHQHLWYILDEPLPERTQMPCTNTAACHFNNDSSFSGNRQGTQCDEYLDPIWIHQIQEDLSRSHNTGNIYLHTSIVEALYIMTNGSGWFKP